MRNVVLSPDREVPMLLFLWKWKVSTTAALIRKFFPTCSEKTAYNRILALRQGGVIKMQADGIGQKFVCTLDKKGFETIQPRIPNLKEDGYKSEHRGHDLLVTAFHLGDWLIETPPGVELFSEQELRRTDPKFYPSWVPNKGSHRPDGYTRLILNGNPSIIAIEVELNQKSDADYTTVANFYDTYKGISKVLWLVPRKSNALNIHSKMKRTTSREQAAHSFVAFEEFQTRGWESHIIVGVDEGKTLSNCLPKISQKSGESPSHSFMTRTLLDLRKSPHVAMTYRGYELGDFSK